MRDPKRIEVIIDKLNKLWLYYPDWRLGQLIINVLKQANPNIINPAIFYCEDHDWEALLNRWLNDIKQFEADQDAKAEINANVG